MRESGLLRSLFLHRSPIGRLLHGCPGGRHPDPGNPQNRGMSPQTPKTITRLDPAVPLLWRDGETLQIGIEGTLRIAASEPWVERLVGRMAAGFRRTTFDVIAHAAGAPRADARMLLARLEPLLVDDTGSPRAAWVEGLDLLDGRCEYRMRDALVDEGVATGIREQPGDIGVVLVEGAAAALQFARYLREDTTHLPVALERGRTTVGPLIIPGDTPCLTCRDEHERDRDDAWPRMHAQLIGRAAGPISAARVADAATLVAQLLAETTSPGSFVEVRGDGRRAWRSVPFHEECRCREQTFLSLPGSATAPAPPALLTGTTTATEYARRA